MSRGVRVFWKRALLPFLAAGTLLQAASCSANELIAGLTTSILSAYVTDIVFGAFNLSSP